jgi:hypothetical protein
VRATTAFNKLLRLPGVFVTAVTFERGRIVVDVRLTWTSLQSGTPQMRCPCGRDRRSRRKFTAEFKRDAVKLVRSRGDRSPRSPVTWDLRLYPGQLGPPGPQRPRRARRAEQRTAGQAGRAEVHPAELVSARLEAAVATCGHTDGRGDLHSDRGSQYTSGTSASATSWEFAGRWPHRGRLDNAVTESFSQRSR